MSPCNGKMNKGSICECDVISLVQQINCGLSGVHKDTVLCNAVEITISLGLCSQNTPL